MKVYIGFSVDMDRAYFDCNTDGKFIPKSHPDYKKIQAYKDNFIQYTNKLLTYFENNKYHKSVTWFVNEADFLISVFYNDILKRCSESGELGLHTHLNSKRFNAGSYNMSENGNDWEDVGIKNANKNISALLKYKNFIYKAGNHIRNDVLFDVLADNLFSIDTTQVINDGSWKCNECERRFISLEDKKCSCKSNEGITLFNDTNISLGSEPFLIKCKNGGVVLEIPEIRVGKVLKHVKECEENKKLCFVKLQIHHWQYVDLVPKFDELIKNIKELQYDVEFIDTRQMQFLFFDKKRKILDARIMKNIKEKIPNDTYYNSLKKCINNDFLELSTWLFNFYDKRSKIIELFAGIGQCSLFLHDLGFSNLTISDFDDKRCNFYKELDVYENITSLVSDFYDINLNNYDVCFFGNSINTSLCHKLDIQVEKYQHFIDQNKLLIIHFKYGSGLKEFNYLLDHLKRYSIIKQIGNYFALKKINNDVKVIPFSKQFKIYKTIGLSNNEDEIICDKEQEVIKIVFQKNIVPNAGIYCPIYYAFADLKEQLYKCKLSFDVKIEKEIFRLRSKIKIYTGEKWVILDNRLTEDYQALEIIDEFNFFKSSTYRIGFLNIESTSLYLKNIHLVIL
jgi:hypothetical protein|tara:strand:+ start:359 stop:2224 length:1866 start_codon:yes stop_codon:yes gene_type:complete